MKTFQKRQAINQKDTLEKVYLLADLLKTIAQDNFLQERLVLKGGTAINFIYFNMPRLSVDIDLNFISCGTKENMLKTRENIDKTLVKIFNTKSYDIEKFEPYALTQYNLKYINTAVNIDINESNKPKILVLKEYIPHGFTVSDHDGGYFDAEKRILRWFVVESAYYGTIIEDTSFTYRLIPETEDTEYLFGTVGDVKELYMTEGDNTLECTINASLLNDTDGDEWPDYLDCEPLNPNVYPGAPEICNGIDDDCDGEIDEGVTNTCMNYTTCTTYETCAACPPEPDEICRNGIDDNCNGEIDEGCPPQWEDPIYGSFTVTRSLPANTSADTEFNVTITVNINESDVPSYYVIKEYIPFGINVTDRDHAYYDADKRMLRWFVVESDYLGTNVEDTTYTYTLVSGTPATYNFTGQVTYREVHFEIGGKSQTDIY